MSHLNSLTTTEEITNVCIKVVDVSQAVAPTDSSVKSKQALKQAM
jgi:hypothetical protein